MVRDRKTLAVGTILVFLGLFFLLRRTVEFRGPGPILLLIGAILLTLSALRRFTGPILPGCVLLGLGSGFLLRGPLEPVLPHWATLLLGLGCGFLLAGALGRFSPGGEPQAAVIPGVVLVGIALAAGLARAIRFAVPFESLWPWVLVIGGVVLIVTARRKGRRT